MKGRDPVWLPVLCKALSILRAGSWGLKRKKPQVGRTSWWARICDVRQFLVERAPFCIPSSKAKQARGHSQVHQVS